MVLKGIAAGQLQGQDVRIRGKGQGQDGGILIQGEPILGIHSGIAVRHGGFAEHIANGQQPVSQGSGAVIGGPVPGLGKAQGFEQAVDVAVEEAAVMGDAVVAEGQGSVQPPVPGGPNPVEAVPLRQGIRLLHQGGVGSVVGLVVRIGFVTLGLRHPGEGGRRVVGQIGAYQQGQQQGGGAQKPGPPGVQRRQPPVQGLPGQQDQYEGQQEGVAIEEKVGVLEQVPHPIQGRQPHGQDQGQHQGAVSQLLPDRDTPKEEVGNKTRGGQGAAEEEGQVLAEGLKPAGQELGQQLQGGEVDQAGIVGQGDGELAAEHGQQGGQPQPGGEAQGPQGT